MDMKTVVTGGTGRVGTEIVKALGARGGSARVLTRNKEAKLARLIGHAPRQYSDLVSETAAAWAKYFTDQALNNRKPTPMEEL